MPIMALSIKSRYKAAMEYQSYQDLLNEEFDRRKQFNSAYSLRAFARDLGLAAPRLSLILNKKQGISVELATNLAKKMKLSEEKAQRFCDLVGSQHSRSNKEREQFRQKIQQYKVEVKTYSELHLEYFKVISDWYHFAILELTYLKDFKNDPLWMANILEITVEEVTTAIERMKNLGLISEENGKLLDTFKFLATPSDVPSASLKKFNTQLMKMAMEALYSQDILEREISSNIFAIDKASLPHFKEKIRQFRRELDSEAGGQMNKNSVYCLSMQLFELTSGDKL